MRPTTLAALAALTLGCAAVPAPGEATSPAPVAAAGSPAGTTTSTPIMPAEPQADVALALPEGWHRLPPEASGRVAWAGPARDFTSAPTAALYRVAGPRTLDLMRQAITPGQLGVDGFQADHPGFVRRLDDVVLDGTAGRRAWTVTRTEVPPGGDLLRLDVVAFRADVGYWLVFTAATAGDEHVARAFGLEAMGVAETWRWVEP